MKKYTRQERIEYWTEKVLEYQKALETQGNGNTQILLEKAEERIRQLVNEQAEVERRLANYREWIQRSVGSRR